MTFGVTINGFNMKRLADISAETRDDFISEFGPQINLDGRSPLGQIKGVYDDRLSNLWEALQAVYDSQYPETAEGVSLDNVASITGTTRLPATKSIVTARIFGDIGTDIPTGFTLAVSGNETSHFLTTEDVTVGSGIDEVQTIIFSGTPTSGSFKLNFDGQETAAIQWDDLAADIQTELNALSNLSDVTVTGTYGTGFIITFTGADGEKDQPLLTYLANTLDDGGAVIITITETTKGYLPFADIQMASEEPGAFQAPANSLTVIITPIGGINSATNLFDADVGSDLESDSDLKIRRSQNLQRSGTATISGIRAKVLEVENVDQVLVVENVEEIVVDGRPPKSFETYVLGGANQDIADAIFTAKPAGIEAFGSITESVTDSEGVPHDISFSRPVELDIWIIINIDKNTDPIEGNIYPVDGDAQVETKILEFVQGFRIGQDVIVNRLYTPINEVAGVIGIEILIGTAPAPTLSNNISVDPDEIAKFDSTRIEVNS